MLEEWQLIIRRNDEPFIRELVDIAVLGELRHIVIHLPRGTDLLGRIPLELL